MAGIYKTKPEYDKQIKGRMPQIPKVNHQFTHKMDDSKEIHVSKSTKQKNLDFSKI